MENINFKSLNATQGCGRLNNWQRSQATLLAPPSSSASVTDHVDSFAFTPIHTNSIPFTSPKDKQPATNTPGCDSPSSSLRSERAGRVLKRQRNTDAARRYRQRKVDRLTELEDALAAMTDERDELKLKLARSEAETEVLRGIMGK